MALLDKWLFRRARLSAPAESPAAVAVHEVELLLRAPTALMRLSEDDAWAVARCMHLLQLPSGTTLIHQGSTSDTGFMVLLLDGDITVEHRVSSHNPPVTLAVLGPGSLLGEMSLVDGAARSASCTASTDVRCAVLTRKALESLLKHRPHVAARLMTVVAQNLAERLRDSSQKLRVQTQLLQTLLQEMEPPEQHTVPPAAQSDKP